MRFKYLFALKSISAHFALTNTTIFCLQVAAESFLAEVGASVLLVLLANECWEGGSEAGKEHGAGGVTVL